MRVQAAPVVPSSMANDPARQLRGRWLVVARVAWIALALLTVVYFWLTEHARLQRYVLAFVPTDRRKRAHHVWNAAETRLGMLG